MVKTASTEMTGRFCYDLKLSQGQKKRAHKIASEIDAQNVHEQMVPEFVVGVSIYLATATEEREDWLETIGEVVGVAPEPRF